MSTVATIIDYLEHFAPRHLAAEWDNVGLLLGDRAGVVKRVMTCLTATPETAAEAVEARAQLIVSHHPILFRPVQQLTTATPEGRMLLSLVQAQVAVYSPHTAFDNTLGGINDMLARRLGLSDVQALRPGSGPGQCKIVVFVPDSDLAKVSDAMFGAGAGRIGAYSECSFRLAGTGTFFGLDAANPTIGKKGRREEVSEWRLEVVCPAHAVARVVAAMRQAHSYEEPAFDIYPLQAVSAVGEGRLGRIGPTPLTKLAKTVKQKLGCGPIQVVGNPQRKIERLAIVCGAGGDFVKDAVRAGADVLLTGEARFHDYLLAEANNLALVLPGHYATERPGVEELATLMQKEFPDVKVWASEREKEPAIWI